MASKKEINKKFLDKLILFLDDVNWSVIILNSDEVNAHIFEHERMLKIRFNIVVTSPFITIRCYNNINNITKVIWEMPFYMFINIFSIKTFIFWIKLRRMIKAAKRKELEKQLKMQLDVLNEK